ncbi:Hypothetical predicted protein [Olea europaea subsp. europaea]|uniref:Uncharacterized protein n=1 Tax=Olea europaea subsp. europaea TaxID=158383 RepID=A0A8S0TTD2_OLEEU|nr:Hypothetical predicted protein [Olea europaea subsp. europaea]
MENIDMAKDGRGGEDLVQCVTENTQSADENLLSKRLTRKLEPEHTVLLNFRRSRTSTSYRELFLHCDHGLYYKIPKHIISIDEKNVLGCLELICRNRLGEAACSFASEVATLSDSLANLTESRCRSSYDMAKLFIECPLPVGTQNVNVSSTGINRTITSKSTDISKNLSFNQFSPVDGNANSGRTSLLEICEPAYFEFVNPPRVLSNSSSSCKLMKDATVLNHVFASAPLHKRIIPVSSTNSTCSDQSSSSSSCATLFKGMLQCTWKNGLPQYTFSMDDTRKIYVASSFKVESPDGKVLDCVYTFHSMENGSKDCDKREVEPELVGKMRVSSSITFCSNNSEIMETRFVLFRSDDNNLGEMQSSSHSLQQNKRLARKIVDVFKSTRSYKERPSPKFVEKSASFEDTYRHSSHQVQKSPNPVEASVESQYAPNLELAAIVMRHHTCKKSKESGIGGWGLKFLERSGINSLISSECSPQNCGECSMSMNIIVPADVHGGPRTRIGGPSSLIERWISGGRCDCGGWDIGCPLTVLDSRSCIMEASPPNSRECKSFELFIQVC